MQIKDIADLIFRGTDTVPPDSDAFLAIERNKSAFLNLLAQRLSSCGHIIMECSDDADVQMVSTALRYASEDQSAIVVAEDTDILCYSYTTGALKWPTYISKEN